MPPKFLYNIKNKRILSLCYFIWRKYIYIMGLYNKSKISSHFDIPIIINNRNRLTFLQQLITALEIRGYKNIHIIDNNSNYKPLLEFYNNCPYNIFRLDENIGSLALWQTKIYKQFFNDYYVYTDSDVVPAEDCPHNFLQVFHEKMKIDKSVMKVGLGLKIDNLPDCYSRKNEVLKWEKQFNESLTSDGYYNAIVDTTFALYRPFVSQGASSLKMLRSQHPYMAHHMPWYNDCNNLDSEEIFYVSNARTDTHWTSN